MRACGLCGAPAGRRLHEGVGPGDLGAASGRGRGGSGVEGVGLGEVDDEGAAGALVDEAALEVDDGEAGGSSRCKVMTTHGVGLRRGWGRS